jgi:hypothetical protein
MRIARLVKPHLSADQAHALVAAAEDRAFKVSLELMMHPQQGNREPILLAGAVSRLKDALAEREQSLLSQSLSGHHHRD